MHLQNSLLLLLASVWMSCTPPIKSEIYETVLSLNGNWMVESDTIPPFQAEVPGTIHTDLLNAGKIGDPFANDNEAHLQWIEELDFTYSRSFEVSALQLENEEAARLIFDGLDTYANVYLNDSLILSADNMFRSWEVSVKEVLRVGENTLKVKFFSPVTKQRDANSYGQLTFPADNDPTKTAPFVRKAAYHFGWDWGPRFVTCGMYRGVRLEFGDRVRIRRFRGDIKELTDSIAKVDVHVQLENPEGRELRVQVHKRGTSYMPVNVTTTGTQVTVPIEIFEPKRWWPNGAGEQHRYEIGVSVWEQDQTLDFKIYHIGLREIELVNAPDSIGTSYYFKVNGEPLFMKGANYIPQDVFLPRVTPEQYDTLLQRVHDAGMNMLRVWGGGVYEDDRFYELCDSLGILVWQDFMFAGTMYPWDADFIANVEAEADEQLGRLNWRPCIALWCGNNEIDVAWHNWGWQQKYGYSPSDSAQMWQGYLDLFEKRLPALVEQHAGNYISTSPTSNWGTPENFNHGSMHYWGVWHGREPISSFEDNVGRFMVEYGMQSYPHLETLRDYLDSSFLVLGDSTLMARQKSYIGNGEIERHLTDLGLTYDDLKSYIAATHEAQAVALQTAISAHLKAQPHCMGTLFWQLNDCWPGPSWSVIDYRGRLKPAYHEVRGLFTNPEDLEGQ
jgi:beta-mannosidase